METKDTPVNTLLEGAEAYAKTSFELLKLKFVSKSSDIFTMVIYHFFVVVILSFFLFGVSVAVALWLGQLFGKLFLGFIAVGAFYGLLAAVLFLIRTSLKDLIASSVIGNFLSETPKS